MNEGGGDISEIASCWYWRPRGCGIEIMSNTVKLDNMSMTPLLTAPSSSSSPHVTLIWGVWAWIEERLAMNVKIVVESVNVAECDDWNGKLRPFFSYPLNQKMVPNHMKNKTPHSTVRDRSCKRWPLIYTYAIYVFVCIQYVYIDLPVSIAMSWINRSKRRPQS